MREKPANGEARAWRHRIEKNKTNMMWKTACVRDRFTVETLKIKFYFVALQRSA